MHYRVRPDLEFFPVLDSEVATWVIRDPLTGSCFHLDVYQYSILQDLKAGYRLDQVLARYARRFPSEVLSIEELQVAVLNWIRQKLVLSTVPDLTDEPRQKPRARLNPLAIRIPLWNPRAVLDFTLPLVSWIYQKSILLIVLGFVAITFSMALAELPTLVRELAKLPAQSDWRFWALAAVILFVAKFFHELGHAWTCHYFGGKCNELGVIFLVGFPCLYCNVTDAWTFPKRWQRLAVTAAGIGVDLVLASIAFLLWRQAAPGLLKQLLLLMAVTGSLNSLFLNGNPLMRYDGYFLLADWVGIPNLRAKAHRQLRRLLWRFLGGPLHQEEEPFSIRLACYGLLSSCYLVFVLLLISLGLYHFFEPAGLSVLAVVLIVLALFGMFEALMQLMKNEGSVEAQRRKGSAWRWAAGGALFLCGLAMFALVPLPRSVTVSGVVRPRDRQLIVTEYQAVLDTSAAPTSLQDAGEIVVELIDPNLQQEMLRLQTELKTLKAKQDAIRNSQRPSADKTALLQLLEEQRLTWEQQKMEWQKRTEAATIRSQQGGIWIPAPDVTSESLHYSSTELTPENRGVGLKQGQVLGMIDHSGEKELLIQIPEESLRHLQVGQAVKVFIAEGRGIPLPGKLIEISGANETEQEHARDTPEYAALESLRPQSNIIGGEVAYGIVSMSTSSDQSLTWNQLAKAQIRVPSASLGSRLTEFFRREFR